ncbi:thermonuclease family protein [Rhizobium rhizogenes]|uniref:thermonuclease family protein n=1 Tax=Rhizobium rhizogenes TaxID=359 RepID=UPI001F213E7F|nr:thermonuclease family protein [Rhizobium rhizogenes]
MAQKNVLPFRRNRKVANDRPRTNASRSTSRRHRRGRGRGFPTAIVWAAVIAAAGWLYLDHNGHLDSAAAFVKAPAQDALSASFALCSDGHRTNCVVDGDTFWFEGQKIRIGDIDTPELSPPRCEAAAIIVFPARERNRGLRKGRMEPSPFAMGGSSKEGLALPSWGEVERGGRALLS